MGGYVETQIGGATITEWVSPPPAPTHKTEGLTQTEWIGLFLPNEVTLHTKTRAIINLMDADFSYLSGGHLIDQPATMLSRPDATYRDLMRDVYFHFDRAQVINCSSVNVIRAMAVQVALGLISQQRSDTIIKGKPL